MFDVLGLLSQLRACSVSVAASGVFLYAVFSIGPEQSGEATNHIFFKTHV